MSKKPERGILLSVVRLLSSGRIQLTFSQQGVIISAENALAIVAAVIVVALLV
jgi:hypothetical protein